MLKPMTVSQQFPLSIAPTDSKGRPAEVEAGSVTWGSSNDAVAKVVGDPVTGTSVCVAQGPGSYEITATGDAKIGEGEVLIFAKDSGTVTAGGEAVAGTLVQGEVVEQPEVVPVP